MPLAKIYGNLQVVSASLREVPLQTADQAILSSSERLESSPCRQNLTASGGGSWDTT